MWDTPVALLCGPCKVMLSGNDSYAGRSQTSIQESFRVFGVQCAFLLPSRSLTAAWCLHVMQIQGVMSLETLPGFKCSYLRRWSWAWELRHSSPSVNASIDVKLFIPGTSYNALSASPLGLLLFKQLVLIRSFNWCEHSKQSLSMGREFPALL